MDRAISKKKDKLLKFIKLTTGHLCCEIPIKEQARMAQT